MTFLLLIFLITLVGTVGAAALSRLIFGPGILREKWGMVVFVCLWLLIVFSALLCYTQGILK